MLLLMTNRNLHMRFRLAARLMALDDLELLYVWNFSEFRVISQIWEATTAKRMTIDLYCQRCIDYVDILLGVPLLWGVQSGTVLWKNIWGAWPPALYAEMWSRGSSAVLPPQKNFGIFSFEMVHFDAFWSTFLTFLGGFNPLNSLWIWACWPLIIWEATTAKQNLSEITIEPINSANSRTTVSKNLGGLGKIWGGCAPLAPT